MINFVVVSHNKKLAQEAINLAKSMQMFEFEILNAGGLQDSEEYGT
ncbi:diguanylate cyclase, partial [Mycoplasmopsis pullorum]